MSKEGIVYKLSKNGKDYYGSTCMTMAQRMTKHRQHKKHYNGRNCASSVLFEDGDPEVEILERVAYDNIKELREVEDRYIVNNECININRAIFDRKRYEDKNRDYINKKQRERRKLKDMTEKTKCNVCGLLINKAGMWKHKKTKKCMSFI